MLVEDRIDIELSDVRGRIEQEGKPSNPRSQLNFADFADLWWQLTYRLEDLLEKGEKARIVGCRWPFEPRIPLLDVGAADQQCASESNTCDHAEYFELCVSKDWKYLWQVQVT